ncbi:MAG: DUF4270 domain-containing protein [Flavobacterium sp.]|uniref:DUF4270 domain-containing protein n=1 Tax=Flavobacterium sp. TaxID=239 RepID=UPI0012152D4F|nr:DUF4270 domain-containing protein [Flavobacterium sp.]RZJ68540.1 MAG: DUF4270 domain-containing protein [Flavobacterium sp.]
MIPKFLIRTALFFSVISLVSCDKDFNEIGTDIIDDDHYGFNKIDTCDIATTTYATGVVQTDGLDVNPFGVYNDPIFGTTQANYVTQLQMDALGPTIEGTVVLEDVTLYIPYDVTLEDTRSDGSHKYEFNELKGDTITNFNLQVYENGYFLREQTHEAGELVDQRYYNDLDNAINSAKGPVLNTGATDQNTNFRFSAREFEDSEIEEGEEEPTITRTAPGMRLKLNLNYFRTKILETTESNLSSQNTFMNYFRGLYFNISTPSTTRGAMNMMNFAAGTITVKYTTTVIKDHDNDSETPDEPVTTDRSIVLNMTGTHVSLLNYQNVPSIPQDRILVKGGQGFMTTVDILNPQQIAKMKEEKWLINEANLIFNIDRNYMTPDGSSSLNQSPEPKRVFVYDMKNNIPIIDYYFDNTTAADPKFNKLLYGGILEVDDNEDNPRGERYKVRVTNYLRSLIRENEDPTKDSTNVKLGLSLTEDISNITMYKLKTPVTVGGTTVEEIPRSHIASPYGTVIYGPNIPAGDPNYDKRLKLVIYYTKPD